MQQVEEKVSDDVMYVQSLFCKCCFFLVIKPKPSQSRAAARTVGRNMDHLTGKWEMTMSYDQTEADPLPLFLSHACCLSVSVVSSFFSRFAEHNQTLTIFH